MKKLMGLLVAVAMLTVFVGAAQAADDGVKVGHGKGAVAVAGESVMMTCGHCKDDYVVKLTKPSKGTQDEKAFVGTHLCEKCGDKMTTKGTGKATTPAMEHTCKGCTMDKKSE